MKKNLIFSLLVMSILMVGVVSAATLTLENKIPCSADDPNPLCWSVIEDGTQGTLTYNEVGQEFEYYFEAEGLDDVEYALIYYADDEDRFNVWGGSPAVLINSGTASSGELELEGSIDIGDLPFATDWNIDGEPNYCDLNNGYDEYEHCYGAKIWLVPMSDYNKIEQTVYPNWNPTKWLFETDLITYVEDDDGPIFGETTIEPEYPSCEDNLITISSDITDESGVDSAELFWKYDEDEFHKAPQFEDGLWITQIFIEPEDEREITYYIKATDKIGNVKWSSESYEHLFTYDCLAPITTLIVGDPNYGEPPYISSDTEISLTCDDAISGCDKIYYKIDDDDWEEYTESINAPEGTPDGLYTIYYYAVDNAGNEEDEKSQEVIIDNTEPEVVLTELEEFYNSTPINLEFIYSDSGSGVSRYKVYKKKLGLDSDFVDMTEASSLDCIGTEDEGVYTTTCDFDNGPLDGEFQFKVEIVDNVENSQDSNIVSTILDRWGPFAVDLDFPEDDSYLNYQPLLLWFKGQDNNEHLKHPDYGMSGIKEYEFVLDGGKPIILNELSYQTSELEEGEHTWKVKANDNAGNEGEWSEERTFVIDTTAPEISNVNVEPYYEGSIYVAGTITASATVTDSNGVDSVTFGLGNVKCTDDDDSDGWACAIDTTSLEDREYNLIVTAIDVAENENVDDSLVVIVDNTAPITEIISPEESSLFASNFDVSVEDSDESSGLDYCEYRVFSDNVLTKDWTLRNCNDVVTLTVEELTGDCRDEGEDICKVEVRATDNLGNENIVIERTFSIDWTNPPQILSSGPSETIVNNWAVLNVETNKPATCRYDTEYKSSYDAMSYSMENTGNLEHTQLLESLVDTSYNYYVLCKDLAGNKMLSPASVSFDVDTRENFVVTIPETKGDYLRIGWNQFFLPSFVLDDTSLEYNETLGGYEVGDVLESIEEKWDMIYHFDGTDWKITSYVPGREVNDLEIFNGGEFPYFIHMNIPGARIEIN